MNGDGSNEADLTFYLGLFGNGSDAPVAGNRGIGTISNEY